MIFVVQIGGDLKRRGFDAVLLDPFRDDSSKGAVCIGIDFFTGVERNGCFCFFLFDNRIPFFL